MAGDFVPRRFCPQVEMLLHGTNRAGWHGLWPNVGKTFNRVCNIGTKLSVQTLTITFQIMWDTCCNSKWQQVVGKSIVVEVCACSEQHKQWNFTYRSKIVLNVQISFDKNIML